MRRLAGFLDAVAERIGSSIGALYNYFPDKQSIAFTLVNQYAQEVGAHWKPLMEQAEILTYAEFADRFIERITQLVQERPAYLILLVAPTQVIDATEHRNVSLLLLSESKTNPRRIFEDAALKELAESIRPQGVLSPLLVRLVTENDFEIVAGARRYRAAQMAEQGTVPVRLVSLTDAETLEARLAENLMRRDVHPMKEANGFRALLNLEEPKYFIEQIAARTGKSPAYCAARLKLATSTKNVELGMLQYSDDIDCGTRYDRQKPENDIHHKRHGKIIEVVLFVFCSLPFHVLPFMPDRFIDEIIAKLKIDRQYAQGFVE